MRGKTVPLQTSVLVMLMMALALLGNGHRLVVAGTGMLHVDVQGVRILSSLKILLKLQR